MGAHGSVRIDTWSGSIVSTGALTAVTAGPFEAPRSIMVGLSPLNMKFISTIGRGAMKSQRMLRLRGVVSDRRFAASGPLRVIPRRRCGHACLLPGNGPSRSASVAVEVVVADRRMMFSLSVSSYLLKLGRYLVYARFAWGILLNASLLRYSAS